MIIRKMIRTLISIGLVFFVEQMLAAAPVSVNGQVRNTVDKKAVDFATIVIFEARKKVYSNTTGNFKFSVEPGEYTVRVSAAGWRPWQQKIKLTQDRKLTIWLNPTQIQGGEIVIRSDKEKQKISRYTMKVSQLKETPATLGDPLNALTTLPGINRSFGLFGEVVVRAMTGTYGISNYFEMDGMPLLYPQHFGGIHAVVSLDLIEDIDLYASAFPAEFGNTYSAVFSFNSKDNIKEMGGYVSINIISANFEFHTPIDKKGSYVMVAGRAGYLSVLVPAITKLFGNEVTQLPDYYDYQLKVKKYLDQNGKHALQLLFLGAKDAWKYVSDYDQTQDVPDDVDPLNLFWRFRIKNGFDNAGFYYIYQPSKKFFFQQILYSSYNTYITEVDNEYLPPDISGGIDSSSNQWIYGLKNKIRFTWWPEYAELSAGTELLFYDFNSDIKSLVPTAGAVAGAVDIFEAGSFDLYTTKTNVLNIGTSFFLENKFTYNGWKFVPGVRLDWLRLSANSIHDTKKVSGVEYMDPVISPRGLLSYKFSTDTTIGVAGGIYYSYVQSSIFWMQQVPEIVEAYYTDPEKAIHRVFSVEQKWGLNFLRAELFYNTLHDMVVVDQRDTSRLDKYGDVMMTRNSGKGINKGFEIMFRRDKRKNAGGFYGWLSYAYTDAKFNLGLPAVAGYPADDEWYRNDYENRHVVKFTGGYTIGRHTFSARYEFSTSAPYTPIVGNNPPTTYTWNGETRDRYAPVYGDRNTKHYDPSHRLDVRYAYKKPYSWGYVSFYFEVILITNDVATESWNYNEPYSSSNPTLKVADGTIPFIPLIGAEAKF